MVDLFVNYWWQLLLVALFSFALGGVNFAILFTKIIKHKDIRDMGSGNPGTTNVFRVFGLRMGALTYVCDVLKGVVPCVACLLIFRYTEIEIAFEYWAGLFAVLGHIFPPFYKFKGGKGIATSMGVCLVTQPILTLCCIIPMLIVIFAVDRMSVVSLLFAVFMIVWHWTMLLDTVGLESCVFISCMFAVVIFAHRNNILRLLTGKEMRTGVRRKLLRKDKREARLAAQAVEEQTQAEEHNSVDNFVGNDEKANIEDNLQSEKKEEE